MSVTINNMDLIFADFLAPDQLMEGDLIKSPDHEIVKVVSLTAVNDGWLIEATNDYDESIEFIVLDDAVISWYVFPIDDDD